MQNVAKCSGMKDNIPYLLTSQKNQDWHCTHSTVYDKIMVFNEKLESRMKLNITITVYKCFAKGMMRW